MYTGRTIVAAWIQKRKKKESVLVFHKAPAGPGASGSSFFLYKGAYSVEVSREAADGPPELEGDRSGEVFGIGIESGGPLFWFHRKTETETAGP